MADAVALDFFDIAETGTSSRDWIPLVDALYQQQALDAQGPGHPHPLGSGALAAFDPPSGIIDATRNICASMTYSHTGPADDSHSITTAPAGSQSHSRPCCARRTPSRGGNT
ncbi:hypothetical protein [Streptomyces sp. FZ201]|uniref:hypothetical protein n=1 Tax=Streptomyces sp. FZ201 TaxID=3057122 RepID=UPI0021BFC25B|nr:hypothetical protein [Streptomyces sp. FZ201]